VTVGGCTRAPAAVCICVWALSHTCWWLQVKGLASASSEDAQRKLAASNINFIDRRARADDQVQWPRQSPPPLFPFTPPCVVSWRPCTRCTYVCCACCTMCDCVRVRVRVFAVPSAQPIFALCTLCVLMCVPSLRERAIVPSLCVPTIVPALC
jgi:hypothetical protein